MNHHTGQCLCGNVAYEFKADVENVTACHCSQCRRTSGHFWAAFHVPRTAFHLTKKDTLTWFASSDWAKRGFCNACGSSLFYQLAGEDSISVAAGTLSEPTGLHLRRHIFTASKGDHYDIADGLPQIETY